MLFRTVGEVPVPRHSLDDEGDDEAPVDVDVDITIEQTGLLATQADIDTLLVCSPRFATMGFAPPGKTLATITLVTKKTLHAPAFRDFEDTGYDEPSEVTSEEKHLVYIIKPTATTLKNFALLQIPTLGDYESNTLAKYVLEQLKPTLTSLWAITPGQTFGLPIVCLYTSHGTPVKGLNVPLATPPALVRGTCAAFVSRAEQVGVGAMCLILNSDGPAGFEVFQRADFDAFSQLIFDLTGLPTDPAEAADMSALYV